MKKERILTNVEPTEVLRFFEDLTFIPRESGNEKEVSDYLVNFAKERNLEYSRDAYNNVLIKKPATPGYEDHPGVILQAHTDMVCEKNPGVEHDFAKDPIDFEIDGDKIIAKETTLGADDGIGVAFCLAILDSADIKHPPLEFVGTTDEERGMSGIENFDFSQLHGDKVINIDSDDEGVIVVGCAGGPVIEVDLPIEKLAADPEKAYLEISLRGLMGGHSGEDIHRGRANANKLMVRLLMAMHREVGMDLADFTGGLKYNAIPRNADAVIGVRKEDLPACFDLLEKYERIFQDEYRVNDADIAIDTQEVAAPAQVLDETSKMRVLDYINFSETGITRMNMDYPELVESSVSLGIVRIHEKNAEIWIMTRSSMVSQYELMREKIYRLTELLGGTYRVDSENSAWEFDTESELKKKFEEVYRNMYGKDPSCMILHAGLEPCEFANRIDRKLDMISMGPDVRFLHAPGEYVTMSSIQKVWEFIKKFFAEL